MGGGLGLRRLLPGLVADLAPELGVRHAGVSRRHPAVDRRGVGPELGGAPVRYLGGREAPGHVRSDERHRPLEVVLLLVHALARLGQEPVGERLGAGRRVLALEPLGAMVATQPAPVARPRPRLQALAGVLGDIPGSLAPARVLRDGAVALDLVGDRGRRAAQVARHGPRALLLVERTLDRGPLRPVEPEVAPLLLLRHDTRPFSWTSPLRACLRSRILGLSRTRPARFKRKDKVLGSTC